MNVGIAPLTSQGSWRVAWWTLSSSSVHCQMLALSAGRACGRRGWAAWDACGEIHLQQKGLSGPRGPDWHSGRGRWEMSCEG